MPVLSSRGNLIGQNFYLWTVISGPEVGEDRHYKWLCVCQCGVQRLVVGKDLKSGKSRSCGDMKIHYEGKNHPFWTGYGDISGQKWASILSNARTRKLEVSISVADAWLLFVQQNGLCALSGLPLKFGRENSASLDRINSNLGYVENNVQWVHKTINRMKGNLSDQNFRRFCLLVSMEAVRV